MDRSPIMSEVKKLRFSQSNSKFSQNTRSGTENFDDMNMGAGMRDIFLLKCQQTIEELHLEIEELKKDNATAEETISKLDRDLNEKETKIRDLTQYKEKSVGKFCDLCSELIADIEETSELKSKVNSLEQELTQAEQKLNHLEPFEVEYQEVCRNNEKMATKIDKLNAQLRNQEQFAKEWDSTLESVNAKIMGLEKEKDDLQKEKEKLVEELKETKTKYEEIDKRSQVLQGKYDYSERLVNQLERENRAMEEVKNENKELQTIIAKVKERSEKLTREVTETLGNQEQDFIVQLERAVSNLQKQHEENLAQLKREHRHEIDRLESIVEELQVDMSKLNTEKAYIKEDFRFLGEKLNSKEKELAEANETFNIRWDQGQREKFEEIQQLKNLIDEQSSLILSYEKMVDKEKREGGEEIRRLEYSNRQLKHEIQELTANNNFLASKLKECQEEFSKIQEEMKSTFVYEEEKSSRMQERSSHLERQLQDRDAQIDALKEETKRLKVDLKVRKKDLEALQTIKKEYNEEILKVRSILSQTATENEDLKERHKDLDMTLKGKMDEMSEELRRERDRRTDAEYLCDDYKEQVRQLETNYKRKETDYRNQIIKREGEIDQMRYQRRVEAVRDTRGSPDPSMRKTEVAGRSSRSPNLDNSKFSLSLTNPMRSANGSAERNFRQREVPGSQKTRVSRFEEPREALSERPQHTEFLDRFKNVISKLETRLEKLSTELNQ